MTSLDGVTSSNPSKDEAGLSTDAEENQPRYNIDGEKDSNSGSSTLQKKTSKIDPDASIANSSVSSTSCVNVNQRRCIATTATHIPSPRTTQSSQHDTGRLVVFNPPKHVLQPHSHRRHFHHHLRDHFSSPQILRSVSKPKENHKEIIPTLDSCEYKDTNFLTEGSPPRTPTLRPYLKAKALYGAMAEERSLKRDSSAKRIKSVQFLPASLWKESPDKLSGQLQCRSSPESESGSESEKCANYLRKYQNESVSGPQQRRDTKYSHQKCNEADAKEPTRSHVRAYSKPWKTQGSPLKSKNPRNGSPKILGKVSSKDSGSSRPVFSTSIPSAASYRGGSHQKSKLYKCQNCAKRRSSSKTTGTQTETLDEIVKSISQSKDDLVQKAAEKSLTNTDMSLYPLPLGVDSSESASYSTEGASSMTFDDDDVMHYVSPANELKSPGSRSDILFRIDEIQAKLQQIKEDTGCGLYKVPSEKDSLDSFVHKVFTEMDEVVTEVSELYDRFDSEEKDEQSEFNELKKQVQQYKRTCRVLEYELMRVDSQRKEGLQRSVLQHELEMSQQISTALYLELQNVDGKLLKVKAENDVFRENMTSSEVHRSVLEREVLQLRNAVDQMSLHASAIPANENVAVKSRDTVPELHRQIQYHEEERRAMLKKLVETDKEKDRLDKKLQLYLSHYGELSPSDKTVMNEESKINDLKARILMEEEQSGILSRRIMELQAENENLLRQLSSNAANLPNPETPSRLSLSDVQFLEDEAETLRMTIEEAENENMALRYELKQFQEKSAMNEKKIQNFQTTQTSLKGLITPTTSDKIAAWDAMDPGTPLTNRTDTDFTLSGADYMPVLTAIDACTQTYIDCPRPSPTPMDKSPTATLTRDFVEILNLNRVVNVESLVAQVTHLAVSTRHLVDDSSTPSPLHSTGDLHSSMMREEEHDSLEPTHHPDVEETAHPSNSQEKHFLDLEKFQVLLLMMIAYIIVTSLSVTSSIKIGILSIIFFLI